jgi:hypothetical protein
MFPLQQQLHERGTMLRYKYIACILCSDDRASSISKWRHDQLDAASDLLIIN